MKRNLPILATQVLTLLTKLQLAAVAMLLLNGVAVAQTTYKWVWTASNAAGTFPTKQAAEAAMRAADSLGQYFVQSSATQTQDQAEITFTIPPTAMVLRSDFYTTSACETAPFYLFQTDAEMTAAIAAGFRPEAPFCQISWNYTDDWSRWSGNQTIHLTIDDVWLSRDGQTLHHGLNSDQTCDSGTYVSSWSVCHRQTFICPAGAGWMEVLPRNGTCTNPTTARVDGTMTQYCSPDVGDPCGTATGVQAESETDYSTKALRFVRSYQSSDVWASSAHLGRGWTHNFANQLVFSPQGSPVWLYGASGTIETLAAAAGSRYMAQSGSGLEVTAVGTQWQSQDGTGYQQTFDSKGKLVSIKTSDNQTTALTYDTQGRLVQVSDAFGHAIQFFYNSTSNLLDHIQLPDGHAVSYAYSSAGSLTSATYPDGTQRSYLYENTNFPAHLTGVIDESGVRFASFADNSDGLAASAQQPNGAGAVTISYLSGGRTQIVDSIGATTMQTFTTDFPGGRRLASSSKNGITESYAYDYFSGFYRVSAHTDARGVQTQYQYDDRNLISVTEALGTSSERTTATQWDPTLRRPLMISVYGPGGSSGPVLKQTSYTYDPDGNQLTETEIDPATGTSRTSTRTYNSFGQLLTDDGPRTDVADVTTYTYYTCTTGIECGQVHTVTNAAGQTTTFNTYNASGQPLTVTDPNGVVTTLTYDLRQRLTSRQVGTETVTFDYWPTGVLKQATLADGSRLEYSYDDAHRLVQISDGLGDKIVYTLDSMGNHSAENVYDSVGVLHRTHSHVINALNQVYQDINAAGTAAVTTTIGYDNNGNQTSVAAPLNRNTLNGYDELNRLKQITDAAGGVTKLAYDASDRLTSVTDPRSLVTTYGYNGFGDFVSQISPDSGTTTKSYDLVGNISTSADARGAIATYARDALNRVSSVAYSIGGSTDQTISFTYDAGTNGKGHLTGASDANHSLSWSYDAVGRVIGSTQVVGSHAFTTGYAYTSGNLTSLTMPSGSAVTYGYNANHQVVSVSVNGNTVVNNITYEPFGQVNGWTWGNGTTTSRTYDTDGNVAQISSAAAKSYTYDSASRITGITDAGTPALSWTYGYDVLDRLNSASGATTQSFTYDGNGNRLSQSGASTSTLSVSASSNRLNGVTGSTTRTYGYDVAGNATAFGGTTFTYNAAGRMRSSTGSSGTTSYLYNALGQRIQKTSTNSTTYFVYDQGSHLIGEYDGTGSMVQEIVWLGETPIATVRLEPCGLSIFYIHTDHLNTPRRITRRSTTQLVWTWESDPFGTATPNENPSGLGTFPFNLRFRGQYYDAETGLNYNMARDYDPTVGRYVESDPLGLRGGINTYGYAESQPSLAADPSGLFSITSSVSYTYQRPLPASGTGGLTVPSIPVSCQCAGCGNAWTLSECSAVLTIQVLLLANVSDPDEANFYRKSEDQHVADFTASMGQFQTAGAAAEASERALTFSSQQECETHAVQSVVRALKPVLQQTWNQSHEYWDHGRHTWYSIWRWLGFQP